MPNRNADFVYALNWANEMHWDDRRKDTDIPYFSHLMSVSALVMEAGGDSEEIIAGLLHDVIEDCETIEYADVKKRFGKRVADIVRGLSDCEPVKGQRKPPWKERKMDYIDHLKRTRNKSILLVSNADKLHNARCILSDLNDPSVGKKVWKRFSASKKETLWYYDSLRCVFNKRSPSPRLAGDLDFVVTALHEGG